MIQIRLQREAWTYDPERPLGKAGGFGRVFEGTSSGGDPVAIKRLEITADQGAHREMDMAASLLNRDLRHVMPILDYGQDAESDQYYLVMPRAQESLEDRAARCAPLALPEGLDILRQIVTGLDEVGDIVHRDLKPHNVLLHDGSWKVADFGIARFVEQSTSVYTVKSCLTRAYAAPEQWKHETAVPATDLYALGCIAHRLLRGEPPFGGPDYMNQHLMSEPPSLDPGEPLLRTLGAQLLRKPPDARPSRARVQDQIHTLLERARKPEGDPSGRPAIEQAAAEAAAEGSRQDAEEGARAREAARRRNLVQEGLRSIKQVAQVLKEELERAGVPVAWRPPALEATLDHARLRFRFGLRDPFPPGAMPRSRWDPILVETILVQGKPTAGCLTKRSASLWYARIPGSEEYRWYEVSYEDNPLMTEGRSEKYCLEDPSKADLAHDSGTAAVQIDYGPHAIDDEEAEAFAKRWAELLANAYSRRLT